jgi:hypothetical protein
MSLLLCVLIPPQVTGLDATAARSCFLMLRSLLSAHGVRLVFAAMAPKVRPVCAFATGRPLFST